MVEADPNNKENEEIEPSFSDPEDFYDDVADEELIGDLLVQKPLIDEYDACCLILFGIPVVGAERMPKLQGVLGKIFTNISPTHKASFPVNPDGGSKGCVLIEWADAKQAEYACTVLNGYKLDKNHVFTAAVWSDLKNLQAPDPNWKPPQPAPYNDVGDLWWWMQDSRSRDQFAVQYDNAGANTVSVFWNVKGHEPDLVDDKASRPNWTESVFKWSPHGSFLGTIHARGVALWGGVKFDRYQRFSHDKVYAIDFSPSEKYLVTYAPPEEKYGDDESLKLWDVRSGELKKAFSIYALTRRTTVPEWPFFKWSHDDKFFACKKAPEMDKLEREKKVNGLAVYDAETLQLVNNRYILVENIQQFNWAPTTRNILAFYSESTDSMPAEIGLLSLPSGEKLRSARIHNVAEAQMFWQHSGQRLAVHTMRFNKKSIKETGEVKYHGGLTSYIEIFDLTEKKDVSLMNVPLPEPFIDFGWQPNGNKFCVLVGNQAKATPMVYRLEKGKHQPTLMGKLDPGVQLNEVSFAPQGDWLVVMAVKSTGGNIIFIDASGEEAHRTNIAEHPGFNKGYWDPTGRYFVSCCTLGCRTGADYGFRMYTFQGRDLLRKNLERLLQFKWRPRPPVNLSEDKIREIKNNIAKTSAKFDREDNEEKVKASQEVIDKRRKILAAFNIVRNRNLDLIKSSKELRVELRGGVDTDADMSLEDLVEEQITVALSTVKTVEKDDEDEEAW